MTRTCTTKQTWIKWDGGNAPAPNGTRVWIMFADGRVKDIDNPTRWDWSVYRHNRIIAYTTDIPVVEFRDWRSILISDLDLSDRTAKLLRLAAVTTLGEVAAKSEDHWLRTPNFGRKSLNELKDVVAQVSGAKAVFADHIPNAGEKVEPTRGAGCDNTPAWLGKALNDGSLKP